MPFNFCGVWYSCFFSDQPEKLCLWTFRYSVEGATDQIMDINMATNYPSIWLMHDWSFVTDYFIPAGREACLFILTLSPSMVWLLELLLPQWQRLCMCHDSWAKRFIDAEEKPILQGNHNDPKDKDCQVHFWEWQFTEALRIANCPWIFQHPYTLGSVLQPQM